MVFALSAWLPLLLYLASTTILPISALWEWVVRDVCLAFAEFVAVSGLSAVFRLVLAAIPVIFAFLT